MHLYIICIQRIVLRWVDGVSLLKNISQMKQRRRSKVAGELLLQFGIGYEIRDRFNEAQKRGKIGGAQKWPQFKKKLNKSYVGRFFFCLLAHNKVSEHTKTVCGRRTTSAYSHFFCFFFVVVVNVYR